MYHRDMIRQQKLEALVLSRRKTGEADRAVTFLTREHGVVKAIAKGVRKIPSSRGGHLEPFTQVLVLLHTSRAGTYVGATETQDYFSPLHKDETALSHARQMAGLIVTLVGENDAHPRIYDLFKYSLRMLPKLPAAKRSQLETAATLLLLNEAGLLPSWHACEHCKKSVPTDSVVLDPTGGWRCLSCHDALSGTRWSLPPRLFRALRYVSSRPESALRLSMTDDESTLLLMSLRAFTTGMLQQEQQA